MKSKKFVLFLEIIFIGAGTLVLIIGYILLRFMYAEEFAAMLSSKLWMADTLVAIVFLWSIYSLYTFIAKPFFNLLSYVELIWRQSMKEIQWPYERQNMFLTIFNTLQQEMDKSRLEIQSYSHQVALRASMIRELKQEYEKKVYDLFTLFDVARELNSTLNDKKISQTMLLTCMGQMGCSFAIVYQLEEYVNYKLMIKDARGLELTNTDQLALDIGSPFIKNLISISKGMVLTEGMKQFEDDRDFNTLHHLNVSLVIPFLDKKDIKVLLAVGPKVTGESFSKDEIEFLSIMTNLGGLALENAKLYTMAITDGLTKLYIQRFFVLKAEEEIKRAKRYLTPLTMLMLDVDNFKQINDTYGHLEGNKILQGIADVLVEGVRETDFVARYGGEEFAVLMPMTNKQAGKVVADRLRDHIAQKEFIIRNKILQVTVSIGEAAYPDDGETASQILDCADKMLYQAKSQGKNRVVVT